jgi:chemotaxis protein histidine kinase CheA
MTELTSKTAILVITSLSDSEVKELVYSLNQGRTGGYIWGVNKEYLAECEPRDYTLAIFEADGTFIPNEADEYLYFHGGEAKVNGAIFDLLKTKLGIYYTYEKREFTILPGAPKWASDCLVELIAMQSERKAKREADQTAKVAEREAAKATRNQEREDAKLEKSKTREAAHAAKVLEREAARALAIASRVEKPKRVAAVKLAAKSEKPEPAVNKLCAKCANDCKELETTVIVKCPLFTKPGEPAATSPVEKPIKPIVPECSKPKKAAKATPPAIVSHAKPKPKALHRDEKQRKFACRSISHPSRLGNIITGINALASGEAAQLAAQF